MTPKVLVLDDQTAYIRSLGRALQSGYEIVGATSPQEAKAIASASIVAALVDIRLREDEPDNRDGLAFIRWLRQAFPKVVAIAMSALDVPGLDAEALAAGAARFLPKPVRVSELKEILRELVK